MQVEITCQAEELGNLQGIGRTARPNRLLNSDAPAFQYPVDRGRAVGGGKKQQSYDGSGNLEAYLAQFEIVAEINGWTSTDKALHLATSLKGPALDILSYMATALHSNFPALVDALQQRFGYTSTGAV
ncbi:Uncharacterised protein at_DN2607 [Pycnogonum litorale]